MLPFVLAGQLLPDAKSNTSHMFLIPKLGLHNILKMCHYCNIHIRNIYVTNVIMRAAFHLEGVLLFCMFYN